MGSVEGDSSSKPSRPLSPKPSRPLSPKTSRPLSPKPSRPLSPKPSRPLSPKLSRLLSPKPSRPLSPKLSRPLSPKPSRPLSPINRTGSLLRSQVKPDGHVPKQQTVSLATLSSDSEGTLRPKQRAMGKFEPTVSSSDEDFDTETYKQQKTFHKVPPFQVKTSTESEGEVPLTGRVKKTVELVQKASSKAKVEPNFASTESDEENESSQTFLKFAEPVTRKGIGIPKLTEDSTPPKSQKPPQISTKARHNAIASKHESRTPKSSMIPIKTPPMKRRSTATRSPQQSRIPRPVRTNATLSPAGSTSSLKLESSSSSWTSHASVTHPPNKTLSKDKHLMGRLKRVPISTDGVKKNPGVVKKVDEVKKILGAVKGDKVKNIQRVSKDDETEVYVVDMAKATDSAVQLPFDKEVICNPEILFTTISKNICNWRMFGRYLLIPDDDIDEIATKAKESEEDKALKILMIWRYQMLLRGEEITYKLLNDALCGSCNNKQILKLKEHHYGSSSTVAEPPADHAARISTEELKIDVPLTEFWENLKPFIENKLSRGYTRVAVTLKFQK